MNTATYIILTIILLNFIIMAVRKRGFAHPYLLIFMGLSFLLSLSYDAVIILHAATFMLFFVGDMIFSNYFKNYKLGIVFFIGAHLAFTALLFDVLNICYYFTGYVAFCGLIIYITSKYYFGLISDFKLRSFMMIYVLIASAPISISFINLLINRTAANWIIVVGSVCLTMTDNIVAYNIASGVDRKNFTWAFYVPAILCWNIGPYVLCG